MRFQETLKQIRENKGLTQEELGKMVGLCQETLSQYEMGKRKPDLDMLIKLANALEVSTDELLGVKLDEGTIEIPKELLKKPQFVTALKRLATADPEALVSLASVIRKLRP